MAAVHPIASQQINTEAIPAPLGPSSRTIPSSATILLGSMLMIPSKPGSFVRSRVIAAEFLSLAFEDIAVDLDDLEVSVSTLSLCAWESAVVAAFKLSRQYTVCVGLPGTTISHGHRAYR
jgi:hypothetical protein